MNIPKAIAINDKESKAIGTKKLEEKRDHQTAHSGADTHADEERRLHVRRDAPLLIKVMEGFRSSGSDGRGRQQK